MDPVTKYGISTHLIQMRIQDLCSLYKDYSISVDVYNTAPYFDPSNFKIGNVELSMNSVHPIDLSMNIKDAESDQIYLGFA
jgi:hypothetical protein